MIMRCFCIFLSAAFATGAGAVVGDEQKRIEKATKYQREQKFDLCVQELKPITMNANSNRTAIQLRFKCEKGLHVKHNAEMAQMRKKMETQRLQQQQHLRELQRKQMQQKTATPAPQPSNAN